MCLASYCPLSLWKVPIKFGYFLTLWKKKCFARILCFNLVSKSADCLRNTGSFQRSIVYRSQIWTPGMLLIATGAGYTSQPLQSVLFLNQKFILILHSNPIIQGCPSPPSSPYLYLPSPMMRNLVHSPKNINMFIHALYHFKQGYKTEITLCPTIHTLLSLKKIRLDLILC